MPIAWRALDLAFCIEGVVGTKRYRERDASTTRMRPVDVVASGTRIGHGCRRVRGDQEKGSVGKSPVKFRWGATE